MGVAARVTGFADLQRSMPWPSMERLGYGQLVGVPKSLESTVTICINRDDNWTF